MSSKDFFVDEKLAAIEEIIVSERSRARANGTSARGAARYEALKAIAADLRGRQKHARSHTLGEITRRIASVKASKTSLGYSSGQMEALANTIISKWPTISQALEQFGEESAE